MQHQIADRMSVNGGYYRRTFGNQTFTDDLRYDASSYDSFCITAPKDPDLPGGGGYQVCGVQDLKPAVFAQNLPANSLIRFAEGLRRRRRTCIRATTSTSKSRFRNGAFLKGGIGATARTFDNCNLLAAGLDAVVTATSQGTETYPDGSRAATANTPYRPDVKMSGSYTLPWDVQLAGTYPVQPRHPDRRRGPEPRLASWAVTSATASDHRRAHLDQRGVAHDWPDAAKARTTASTT